jgi:hypothetical protein
MVKREKALKILKPEDCEQLQEFYPKGRLTIITPKDVHPNTLHEIEKLDRMYRDQRTYKTLAFEQLLKIQNGKGTTYAITGTRENSLEGENRLINLYEETQEGEKGGYGEIFFFPFSTTGNFVRQGPYVGWTNTPEGLERKGRGTERLELLNGLAQLIHGEPLHSSQFGEETRKKSEGPWRKLVQKGKATRFLTRSKKGTIDGWRYAFIT